MLKISLRHPSGLEIDFEGDGEEFDRFAAFLSDKLSGLIGVAGPPRAGNGTVLALDPPSDTSDTADDELPVVLGQNGQIDARALGAQLERLDARTEIERVTVIAQAAIDAGLEGIDYDTIPRIYDDLGIPKPPRFAKAFSNAKDRGFVKSVKGGVWAPTVQGENFARYGKRPARRARRGSAGPTASTGAAHIGPAPALTSGGVPPGD
jgi:hypothetical protein